MTDNTSEFSAGPSAGSSADGFPTAPVDTPEQVAVESAAPPAPEPVPPFDPAVAPAAPLDAPDQAVPEPVAPLDPAMEFVAPLDPAVVAERAATRRRRVRAALRWTAAVAVFAAFCGATAYAVQRPERTKIPGLRTPGDGRLTFPPYALPKLPAGKPRPLADANHGGRHYVDVRSLLLPAPLTAVTDKAVPGPTGWVSTQTFTDLYRAGKDKDKDAYLVRERQEELEQDGLRHIAARAWTTPDGTRTEIYVLQFLSTGFTQLYRDSLEAQRLAAAPEEDDDKTVKSVKSAVIPSQIEVAAFAESKPYGASAVRYAYVYSGDTIGVVIQSRKGAAEVPEVPFRQTVRLQAQLLG